MLAVHRGRYHRDKEYIKRVLCAIVVQGDDLPTKLADWPEKSAFWAANMRQTVEKAVSGLRYGPYSHTSQRWPNPWVDRCDEAGWQMSFLHR